jgi:hypothetical protein
MSRPAVRSDNEIDPVCSAAICEEIGDRLRVALTGAPNEVPQHMMKLVERIARTDSVGRICFAPDVKPQ